MKKIVYIILIVTLLCFGGCVSESAFQEVGDSVAELEASLREQAEEIARLEELLAGQSGALSEAESELTKVKDALSDAEDKLSEAVASGEAQNQKIEEVEEMLAYQSDMLDELQGALEGQATEDFDSGAGDPGVSFACGYRFYQNEFDKRDVKIRFYWGFSHATSIEEGTIVLFASSSYYDDIGKLQNRNNQTILKTITGDKLLTERYMFTDRPNGLEDFRYSERIRIPETLFTDEKGVIWIAVNRENPDGTVDTGNGNILPIAYSIQGEKVFLSVFD